MAHDVRRCRLRVVIATGDANNVFFSVDVRLKNKDKINLFKRHIQLLCNAHAVKGFLQRIAELFRPTQNGRNVRRRFIIDDQNAASGNLLDRVGFHFAVKAGFLVRPNERNFAFSAVKNQVG